VPLLEARGHEAIAIVLPGMGSDSTADRWGRLPRAYIECTDDRILPIGAQRAAHAALPCDPVIAIDSDHSPFFSAPDVLADALDSIAVTWGS
jgi:pimeloyl-ACP methyl ester carboxylesterase